MSISHSRTNRHTNKQPARQAGRQANRVRLSLFRAFSLKRNTSQKNLLFTAREHSFLVENLCLAGETLVSVLQGLCAKFEMYGWALQSQTLAGLRTFVLMLRNKCFSTRIVRLCWKTKCCLLPYWLVQAGSSGFKLVQAVVLAGSGWFSLG